MWLYEFREPLHKKTHDLKLKQFLNCYTNIVSLAYEMFVSYITLQKRINRRKTLIKILKTFCNGHFVYYLSINNFIDIYRANLLTINMIDVDTSREQCMSSLGAHTFLRLCKVASEGRRLLSSRFICLNWALSDDGINLRSASWVANERIDCLSFIYTPMRTYQILIYWTVHLELLLCD